MSLSVRPSICLSVQLWVFAWDVPCRWRRCVWLSAGLCLLSGHLWPHSSLSNWTGWTTQVRHTVLLFLKIFFFWLYWQNSLEIWQEAGWERGGTTSSKGPQAGTQTRVCCNEDKASVRGPCSTRWAKRPPTFLELDLDSGLDTRLELDDN